MLTGKRILLIVTGGIAAYKALELIRLLRKAGAGVRVVMTAAAGEFVTPMSLGVLSGEEVHTDLFSLKDETEIGHIQLSRSADLVVVAPATADILAKMAGGIADDLATTLLLATDKRVLVAPAMNVRMWFHPATQRNLRQLAEDGILMVGPDEGDMACGEFGPGRMSEPPAIVEAIIRALAPEPGQRLITGGQRRLDGDPDILDAARIDQPGPLSGRHAIVTSGPTHEPIDPVRYIANRSSGKQGHAIAASLAALGARVTLVSGPTRLADPAGVTTVHVEAAREMLAAVEAALPADIAVCAAAVADWRPALEAGQKLKKQQGGALPPDIRLIENPDILRRLSEPGPTRPALVVGFAAETECVLDHADAKRRRKGCDWILANDVATGTGTFGGDDNAVHLLDDRGVESWPAMSKQAVADRLAARIVDHFAAPDPSGRGPGSRPDQ
ncbi:bifunctional phosphopantothenoylcysteine decarboxylase/phosphopantothenate synthase [Tistrella sp. BH-R2-4]|uniref:Coenzyme A biosynthesis bifunctional protein CoaBC n=1 Tax=Tistrella arctica TaxID=3133430 RepID=A0ABU9YG89_9PROT